MTWMRTHYGHSVDLVKPDPKEICIEDIAYALSNIPRFTGHTKAPYSVAAHSVACALYLEGSPRLALLGLLHDAHEAYTGDIATPVSEALICYARGADFVTDMKRKVQCAIYRAFDIPFPTEDETKKIVYVDGVMLATEVRDLMLHPFETKCKALYSMDLSKGSVVKNARYEFTHMYGYLQTCIRES